MRYLFFFVHPSKFHVFRNTINHLKKRGHVADVVITSKDVLEELVKSEGWEYTNIFPDGRKIKGVNPLFSSAINFFRTLSRLYIYTRGKRYDLLITDDLLGYIGKLKGIPSVTFVDSDLSAIRQFSLVLGMTDYILSPDITNLEKYSYKKIAFQSYKELAYLHPNHFEPDHKIVETFIQGGEPYSIIRLVNLRAYHDIGMKGLTNDMVTQLISLLNTKGRVFISSERTLPPALKKHRLKINPIYMPHVLSFAELFVGDSQTMTSEAAVLGTPAFRCNDFIGRLSVMDEKESKYHLSYNFTPGSFPEMMEKIKSIMDNPAIKDEHKRRKEQMLSEKIDLSEWLISFLENFPESVSSKISGEENVHEIVHQQN